MSKSPSEAGNATSRAVVRPEQGPEPAPGVIQTNVRLGTPPRNTSSSLLSGLFSTAQEVGEPSTAIELSYDSTHNVAEAAGRFQRGAEDNNAHDINHCPSSEDPMAMAAPSPTPATLSLRSTPVSETPHFDMSNLRMVNGLPTSHRELLNSKRGRGTSLERTLKEKRVQQTPAYHFSNNPGDTGTINGPAPRSPATRIPSSNDPSYDGIRANYRSWRDTIPRKRAEKAWSIGEQALGEVPGGQVEKSIVEALGGIEPNNRSRKASHSLRFFKEGLVERSNKTGGGGLDKIGDQQVLERSQRDPLENFADVGDGGQRVNIDANSRPGVEEIPGGLPNQSFHDAVPEHQASLPTVTRKYSVLGMSSMADSKQPQSLDEIQQDANIRTSSQAGSIGDQDIHKSGREDDDESGEEQISSAVFVPHNLTRDTNDDKPQQLRDPRETRSTRHQVSAGESEQWLEEHEIPSHEIGENAVEKSNLDELPVPPVNGFLRQEQEVTPSNLPNGLDISHDHKSDTGRSTKDEEPGRIDDGEITPTDRREARQLMPKNHKEHLHHHQQIAKPPLEAIELIPYRHQVGGHTTMWRFSRRAVCKQLNNRENEFYEKIEQNYPQLLQFMPRYIGVLNVTFEKQQKRRASTRDLSVPSENEAASTSLTENGISNGIKDVVPSSNPQNNIQSAQPSRMISQSINITQTPTPTVTFADNRHIIPKSFQQSSTELQEAIRGSLSESVQVEAPATKQPSPAQLANSNGYLKIRPTFSDKHAASWGATTVNKTLRHEVFGEAFLQHPIPIHRHKRPAHQQRQLLLRSTYPTIPSHLRSSNSESNLITAHQIQTGSAADPSPGEGLTANKVATGVDEEGRLNPTVPDPSDTSITNSDFMPDVEPSSNPVGDLPFNTKAATSAPALDSPVDSKSKRRRRYSSGGLRRKPSNDSRDRGDLKYFEEADDVGYKADGEPDVFRMDPEPSSTHALMSPTSEPAKTPLLPAPEIAQSSGDYSPQRKKLPEAKHETLGDLPSPMRPVNPKQAQTQRDKRVEFFLLLEDLTAGMRRPCIMDLKMGTRQYGVDANKKKQESQRHKCAETTSKELGVRVCGLQVWDAATESYVFKDKYFGRKLKAGHDFQDALMRFLYDGVDYASVLRHIPAILQKLSQLEVLIMGLRGYRFYAASLLMFYDGDVEDDGAITDTSTTKEMKPRGREIDFKIADFANCVTAEYGPSPVKKRACPPRHPDEPDKGFLCGLRSLKRYFISIQNEVLQKEKATSVVKKQGDADLVNGNGQFGDFFEEDSGNISY